MPSERSHPGREQQQPGLRAVEDSVELPMLADDDPGLYPHDRYLAALDGQMSPAEYAADAQRYAERSVARERKLAATALNH